jgi:oligoendopeptidase F
LDAYKNMLSLGYTKTIPELFKAGNIEFNFTAEYVGELFDFVWAELKKLS